MADDSIMVYGMNALEDYLLILNTLKSLSWHDEETTPDYGKAVELVSARLSEIKGAFESRKFLKECLDYNISDERIEEFEDFLEDQSKELSGLEEEIKKTDVLLNSLKRTN